MLSVSPLKGFRTPLLGCPDASDGRSQTGNLFKKYSGKQFTLQDKPQLSKAKMPRFISGYGGQVPLEAERFGACNWRLKEGAWEEFGVRQAMARAEEDGYLAWRSDKDMAKLRGRARMMDPPDLTCLPDFRTKRWSLSGYELEVSGNRPVACREIRPLGAYHLYGSTAEWLAATDRLKESKNKKQLSPEDHKPSYFNPYKVIPNLDPYRYPLHSLWQYHNTMNGKISKVRRESSTMFDKPVNEKHNTLIHRYISHVTHPKKILNYPRRITTEIEYSTHPKKMTNNRIRLIDKVDFIIDL